MRVKQSVCYPICQPTGMSLDELFKAVASIGFSAVEMWGRGGDFEDVVGLAKKHNLLIASMAGHESLGEGLNNRANHDRVEAELRQSIEIAVRYAIPNLICFSGNRLPYADDRDGVEASADCLKRVAPFAEQKGINLNIELLNSKVDHAGYQADHTAWGVAVCQKVASPRVKLLYDIYHMQIMEGDVIRTIRQNIRWIGHFHTAGNPGRADLDDTQELNYAGICKAIAQSGYEGYVGHEFRPKTDVVEALRQAFRICNQE